MPVPKQQLEKAIATLSEETLRAVAEYNGIKGYATLSLKKLQTSLSKDPSILNSYSEEYKLSELKAIAKVLGIKITGKKKHALSWEIYCFVEDYDDVKRELTYKDVFTNVKTPTFADDLQAWMTTRSGQHAIEDLSVGERTIWTIRHACMEMFGNSVAALFESGDDDRPKQFIEALKTVGAKNSAKAVTKIGKLLFNGPVPKTLKERLDYLYPDDEDDQPDHIDEAINQGHDLWDSTGENLSQLMVKYASKNPILFK